GVVADDVHLAECGFGLLRRLFHCIAIGDVDLQRDDFRIRLVEFGLHAIERALLDVGDGHFHARRRKRPCHCEPHSARAAGNERNLARNVFHFLPLDEIAGDSTPAGACVVRRKADNRSGVRPGGGEMGELALAGVLFIGAHLGVSSTPLRASLVRAVGDRAYLGLYSLLAAVTLGFLIFAYGRASHADFLWLPTPALRAVPFVLMPIAFTFLLGGFMTRNPTAVGQEATVTQVGQGAGLVRITRHPFQWSVVLWAIGHIVANGDVASLLFF